MRFIKILNIAMLIAVLALFSILEIGCSINDKPAAPDKSEVKLSQEEARRVDLYVKVMMAAYKEENGGNKFIAVKLDTLEGLSTEGKQQVMEKLHELSSQVVDYEKVKNDPAKFHKENDMITGTKEGTVLYIDLDSYSENQARIEGVSWFGSTGAVFRLYDATYKNGQWQLKLIRMAIS